MVDGGHPHAVREALDNGFFGSLDENEGKILHAHKSWKTTLINALDWLLAEGTITVEGSELRVSELLLEGGPRFSAQQRQWIERVAATPFIGAIISNYWLRLLLLFITDH